MTELATTTLPEGDEMMRRLIAVNDTSHLIEQFYPQVMKMARRKLNGPGIVTGLHLALYEYVKGLPSVVVASMMLSLSSYVDALVDDPQVKEDAREGLRGLGLLDD